MKYRFFSACLLAAIMTLVLTQVCYANKKILGRITFCSGPVEIKRAKQTDWRRAVLILPVYFGDHIRTRDKGQATITYSDKSILKIRPNTHIALNTIISTGMFVLSKFPYLRRPINTKYYLLVPTPIVPYR